MGEKNVEKRKTFFIQDRAYFQSETHINRETTDVKELMSEMIYEILNKIATYQKNCSGWYFQEVNNLEILTVNNKPMKGSSYIPLQILWKKKKAIENMQNKDIKCFLWYNK